MAINFISSLPAPLKEEVEQTFGRPVFTAKDCIQLSVDIYNRTRVQVSPHTLRRLFGLVKASNAPSKSTLNILAKYCGFSSLSEVPQFANNSKENEVVHAENVLNFLFSLFHEALLHDVKKETLLFLVKNIVSLLNRELELAYGFHRKIAKTVNGQVLYFEKFVYLDKLNHYWGDSLKYYMLEKKTPEAECFGYSLLVFRYWLTGEDQKLHQSFEQLYKYQHHKFTDPVMQGWFYAAKLLFTQVTGQSIEKTHYDIHKIHFNISASKEKIYGFPHFEYVVSAALCLTGKYREAIYFLDFGLEHYQKDHFYVQQGYYHLMDLFKAIALISMGDRAKAEKIYLKLKPAEFGFLSKKLSMILYLLLAKKLKKNIHKKNEIFSALINETGFTRFTSMV